MKRQITFRLLVMLLTASLLLSSTGLLTMFAKAEEVTAAPTLVTEGSSTTESTTGAPEITTGMPEITTGTPQTTTPTSQSTTNAPETTTVPESTTVLADNSDPTLAAEGGVLNPAGPQVNTEGFVPVGASPQAVTWLGADGTTTDMGKASNPYAVSDAAHFLEIQTLINDTGNADKYFRLTADIDLSTVSNADFKPLEGFSGSIICLSPALAISDPTKIFINFDGAGKSIKDLDVENSSKDTFAIFGYLSANSIVYDIVFENCSLSVTYADAKISAVVAVQNMGIIRDCSFAGSALDTTLDMSATAGSVSTAETFTFSTGHIVRVGFAVFVGDNRGTIQNCIFSDISIRIKRRNFVGGVVAQNSGIITGINGIVDNLTAADYGIKGIKISSENPALSTEMPTQIGGIAGKNLYGATVSDCTINLAGANAVNSFTYGNKVGGVAGANAGTVSNCYVLGKFNSTQTVSASAYDMLGKGFTFGGITGENTGNINNCSAENIGLYFESVSDAIYGGITGTNAGNGTSTGLISGCYASGKQSDVNSITSGYYYVGGIVGSASAGTLLSSCYALVSLSQLIENVFRAGALIGNGANASMLSTASPNYWSRTVSGWPTQGGLDSSDTNDIHRGIKVLNLATNTMKTINKNEFTHTWGNAAVGIDGIDSTVAFSKTSPNLSIAERSTELDVTGGPTASTIGDIIYTLNITLPVGVGASVQPTDIKQQMTVAVVTTAVASSVTPVVSFSYPIVISNATEMLFVKSLPTADYKLGADITMLTGALGWRTSVFAGTFDGNNKTITSHIPIFSKIYGSRDEGPDSPENLAYGYVFNLKLILNANSNSGMLGSVIGGTVKNTTLTGSSTGIALTLGYSTDNNKGAFIDVARGNSYIYGCFTDLKVSIQNSNVGYIGGLIGTINGNKVTVENCGSNSDVDCAYSLAAIASLIGGITNSTGTVKNCFAGGRVQRGGYIAVGNKLATHKLENLYWSIKDINTANQATILPAPNISGTDTVFKWSFNEAIGYVSGSISSINLTLPVGLTRLTSALAGEFSVSVKDSGQIITGTPLKTAGKIKVDISKDPLAPPNINTELTLVHGPTGMCARVTINEGISQVDGYYEIKTAANLQEISAKQTGYLSSGTNFKMKLMNDIDMYDAVNDYQYTYTPIGDPAPATRFKGVFDGNGHTISNLVITGTTTSAKVAMFGQTQGATISNLTLDGARITGIGPSVACIAGVVQAGSIHHITVLNSTIVNNYAQGSGQSYTGGIVGNYLLDGANTPLQNITINNLSISNSLSLPGSAGLGYAGGVVGHVATGATVAIDTVNITDLNLIGKERIGGVTGSQEGNVTIKKVTMKASTGSTPQITGVGYVGGIVGYSVTPSSAAKITDCSVTGITITNTGIAQVGTGATGGIAAWFSGTIGDDPLTTETVEECTVKDCTIQGMIVGGILGRVNSNASGAARNITIKNCNVTGATTVTATDEPTAAAAGILAEYLPTTLSDLTIDTCRVHSSVTVNNGHYAGGILGAVTFATSGKVEVKNSQSFADVATAPNIATTYAGGIIGYCNANVNVTKIWNCVAGGTIRAKTSTGGLLGFMNNATVFSPGTPHITGCYVTTLLPGTDGFKGKIWGYAASDAPLPAAQIANAINYVIYSSYPEDIAPYGRLLFNSYTDTKLTFADINKPDINAPTLFQHSSATPVVLTDAARTATIIANNLPRARTASFAYDPVSGWVSQSTARLHVDSHTATQITVTALRSTNINTGIVAAYKDSGYDIYPSETAEKLTFFARIPVFCERIKNVTWAGDGTLSDPFQISTKDDLDEMRFHVLQDKSAIPVDYFGGYYKLMNDIVFEPADFERGGDFEGGFIPITGGTAKLAFVGSLDGSNPNGGCYAITGLRISVNTADYTGLFEQSGTQTIINTDLDEEELKATFQNLTVSDAVMQGHIGCTYGGILVAKADYTTFAGITIADSSLSNIKTNAGGIVGYATNSTVEGLTLLDDTYIPVTVSGSSIKVNAPGKAGGIAGSFGGSIGSDAYGGEDWDVTVVNTVVEGNDAGGIVGHNDKLRLSVIYTLVSDCSVESKIASGGYSAGGILGRASGQSDDAVSITYTKVDDQTSVTAVCVAGGIVGKMAIIKVGASVLLTLDHIESYAAVKTTDATTSISGGIVGSMSNALIVRIANGVAGGSVQGKTKVGGIIGYIEGELTAMSLQFIDPYFVLNFVVSADITGTAGGAKVGLVLGDCHSNLMPPVYYAHNPFENIKYSSYQYAPGRLMIGNGDINSIQDPDFKKSIFDLNKGFSDNWIADPDPFTSTTYMGLRFNDGSEITMNLILGNEPIQLSASNILLPIFPEALPRTYDFKVGSNYTNFEDKLDLNFTLTGVTSNIANLITYTPGTPGDPNAPGTGTLARNTGEGAGNLIFTYANGLALALKLISYEDLIGVGTQGDPYQISKTSHFDLIRALPTKYYEQINDIAFDAGEFDLNGSYYNGGLLWEPLKGTSTFFTGQYNGGGFTVSGLRVARPGQDDVGFFAKISQGARVYDLTLANATVVGRDYVGSLAGEVVGTGLVAPVSNCHVISSSVTSTTPGTNLAPIRIGGLVALEKSAMSIPTVAGIKDCTVTSTTLTTYIGDRTYAGGIAALAQSIENCTVDHITITAGLHAAGIVAGSSTTTTGGPNTPMSIKGCTVNSVNGASQITANTTIGATVSAGIIAFLDKNIQLTVENCNVTESVTIISTNGAAAGIMGVANSQDDNADLAFMIKNTQSYANVTGLFESGGILGAIKGSKFALSRALIEGCTGGGRVESTSDSLTLTGVGGIIGSVSKSSTGVDFTLPTGAFIKECVASAILVAQVTPVKVTAVGKLVGKCGTGLLAWTYAAYPNAFTKNSISSYPQDIPVFGHGTMMSDPGVNQVYIDLMVYKIAGVPASALTVQNIIEGLPSGDFREVAITPYDDPAVTTYFNASVKTQTGSGFAELDDINPVYIDGYHGLTITGVFVNTLTPGATTIHSSFLLTGTQRQLKIDVTPTLEEAGYLEVSLGYGLKVSVPIIAFEVTGIGTAGSPFEIVTVKHLTLMYYLPTAHFIQMNDVIINPDLLVGDYAAGTYNSLTDKIEGRGVLYQAGYKGFRPVGALGKPFTGSYNGQNHRITGLYSDNVNKDYVGFFGYVSGSSALKNIHIELTTNVGGNDLTEGTLGGIRGQDYVGGLAGWCSSSTTVENCSVAFGQVAGRFFIGGLIGRSATSINRCFTNCDVVAVGNKIGGTAGEAGGLIGKVVNDSTVAMTMNKSFATGSIYSEVKSAGGLIGRVENAISSIISVTDCFFTGDIKSGDALGAAANASSIIIGTGVNTGRVDGSNILVAGTNVNLKGSMSPFATFTSGTTIRENIYYDNSLLGFTTTDPGTVASTTTLLTGATLPAGFLPANWTPVAGSYPRLIMADDYSNAFCAAATIPLKLDAIELENRTVVDGLRFQPSIANTIPEVTGGAITFKASKLDTTDTVAYPAGYDANLYGNGADRNIDLLFKNNSGITTTIYRNIFKLTMTTDSDLQNFRVRYGELLYSRRTPVVTLTATVNGTEVFKRMKLPLESLENRYYLATERQLRALNNGLELGATKFGFIADAIGNSPTSYNTRMHMTADISLCADEFIPIQYFRGFFNANGFTLRNLKINKPEQDNIGLFDKLESLSSGVYVEVTNLHIEDTWINGKNNVGALAGQVTPFSKINNCSVSGANGSYVTGKERVGGLIGWAVGSLEATDGIIGGQSSSAIPVSGFNSVGGFVGVSSQKISSCFATGAVTATIEPISAGINLYGVGGFAGAIMGFSTTLSFATGNVTVGTVAAFVNNPQDIGIGGFVGIIGAGDVSKGFASGAVRANSVGAIKMTSAGAPLMFGIGGVAGINKSSLSKCYSSSSVFAKYDGDVSGAASLVAAGIGGVAGITTGTTTGTISDAYSSGNVLREPENIPNDNANTYFKNAIGGVIGTKAGSSPPGITLLYFDLWNNSYGSTLTAIGGVADAGDVQSLTTDEMCISQALRATETTPLKLSINAWSFNAGAYPCLMDLVYNNVTMVPTPPYIRYPAVLSVIAVAPDSRDTSARTGNGITMAITTPNSLTILGQTYELDWSVAGDSEVAFIDKSEGTTSKFVPVRTANNSQILSLIASIKNNSQYGSRRFDRLCAEMRGTLEKPYLISHKSDLQHIGLPNIGVAGNYGDPGVYYSAIGFDDFYNQWYSPLDIGFNNVQGKVHFQLLSDIDMVVDVNYSFVGGKVKAAVNAVGDGVVSNDNHYVGNLAPGGILVKYTPEIEFRGISFKGNDYSIDNFNSNREFIYGISAASDISDISFNNLKIDSRGTVEENNGTALVRYNQGLIDGCMILSGTIQGGNNVAGIVNNNLATGTITNSTVKATIEGTANVGGIAATNSGSITKCAFDDGTITVNQIADTAANAGAIAGSNSGTINNCFSMGSINSANNANVIGGLVGVNTATGNIGPAYSRTNVSGGNNIGGFAGTNAGTMANAYSAGSVTPAAGATQTGIFCGTNAGTLTNTFADKAMAGKATYALLGDGVTTGCLMNMTCLGSGNTAFTKSATNTAYPQLTDILALDNAYAPGAYIPQKYELLIGYSVLSSAALNTKYSQYIDTLALSTANPVSTISTPETWLSNVVWKAGNGSVITSNYTTGSTGVTETLKVSITINASNGKVYTIEMPIAVTSGEQNPNFSSGDGTVLNPYTIKAVTGGTTATQSFNSLAYYGPNSEINYKLGQDINYLGSCPTKPITEFAGKLDGDKHVIYNLTVGNNSGLFGHLNTTSTITNLGLVGAKTTFVSQPDGYIGLLAGHAQGATITNCYAIGEIETSAKYMGGLVGFANTGTTITGCVTSGKFVNTKPANVTSATGGIVGNMDTATVTGGFSTSYVKGDGIVGGIVGEAINTSTITGSTFAGMVMDTVLAGGMNTPAATTTIGNIAGSIIDGYTVSENEPIVTTLITGCTYDKQITLISDANAVAKFTAELMTGTSYTVHVGLAGGSTKFAAGVAFATMPVKFLLGSSAGSTRSFSRISLPQTIAGDLLLVTETPQHTATYLSVGGADPIIITLASQVDLNDIYAGLTVKLSKGSGTEFENMNNDVMRYVEPRLNRVIKVAYTLTNATGNSALNSETVAVMLKNTHIFAGEPVTYSSDAFTTPASNVSLFEDLLVSSGGIYAGGNLPEGYSYQITAKDQDNATLPVTTLDGEYGTYIALQATTTEIRLSYTIVNNTPWGVYVYWSSLVNALVKP